MSRRRFIVLLLAAVVAIGAASYLSSQRYLPRDARGIALLSTLAAQLNTVTSLSILKGGALPAVTLHKVKDQWTVAQRGDYAADVAKLRKLLSSLGDARIVEEKTSVPANFPLIGVEDPTKPGAAGAQITVVAHDGRHSVIVGNPVGDGNFVRRVGENTSYSVEPGISYETEPRLWIDSRLLDLGTGLIQRIEVTPATGPAYALHRMSPGDGNFSLGPIPAGRKALDAQGLAPSATQLSALTADDVTELKTIDFSHAAQATVTLADGRAITLIGTLIGDRHWLQIKGGMDAALEAKTRGRAFEIEGYRYEAIFRPLEQLLVPKPAAPKVKPAAPPLKPTS